MGRPLLRREGRTAYLGVCTASSCVWKSYRRYGGKTLVGADMPVLHVPAGQGEGDGARGAAAFADAAGGADLAAAFFVRQNRPQRFLPQCKRRSRRPLRRGCNAERRCYKRLNGRKNCIGKGFRSSIHCRKTECGAAILVAEQIWNGYPLLRNGIGRAALRRYKPAWRRRNTPVRRTVGRTGAEAGG